jgi:hypothetical protein
MEERSYEEIRSEWGSIEQIIQAELTEELDLTKSLYQLMIEYESD